jgi:hypothetical protein
MNLALRCFGNPDGEYVVSRTTDGRRFCVDLHRAPGMYDTVFFLGEYERFITEIISRVIRAGDTCLELTGEPLQLRLLHEGQPILGSITDQHFRGFTRLPVIGRARGAAQWVSAFALASGEAVYGLGEKFGPLNKRGQIIQSHVVDALGVNFWPQSKRFLAPEHAGWLRELRSAH